jgi:hypothetical protein
MIENLHFSLLQAQELDAGAERILSLVTESLPADPVLGFLITLVGKDRAALQLALSNAQGSAHTALIAEKDAARDDAFIVFRTHCESATRRRTKPGHVVAGELLLRQIRTAGYSLHAFGNSRETGALNALLVALDAADAKAAVTLLAAGELLSELKEAQSAFELAINDRIDSQAAENYPALAAARAVLGNRLQLLLSLIDSLNDFDTTNARPDLDLLITRINEVIVAILTPARARRTRGENTPTVPVPPKP